MLTSINQKSKLYSRHNDLQFQIGIIMSRRLRILRKTKDFHFHQNFFSARVETFFVTEYDNVYTHLNFLHFVFLNWQTSCCTFINYLVDLIQLRGFQKIRGNGVSSGNCESKRILTMNAIVNYNLQLNYKWNYNVVEL